MSCASRPPGKGGPTPTPPVFHDSERTLILQRRSISTNNINKGLYQDNRNTKKKQYISKGRSSSAYFADTASESSTAHAVVHPDPRPSSNSPTPFYPTQRALFIAPAGDGPAKPKTARGGIFLEGIRGTPKKNALMGHGRWRHGERQVLRHTGDGGDDDDPERENKAPVFCGSIRFPASRVALWNRRAIGRPLTVTPESAAPLLVLRQHAVDLIAHKLADGLQGRSEKPLRWRGIIGPVADILHHSRAADDPRAVSAPSPTALEIAGVLDEALGMQGSGGGRYRGKAAAASARSGGRGLGDGAQGKARMVSVQGALIVDDGRGRRGSGGAAEASSEEVYRLLMVTYSADTATERSASPTIFTPLRLECSLQYPESEEGGSRRVGVAGEDGEAAGSEATSATLSLRGEMIVPSFGIRLTPIAPLALLHTALYQSLLTRGAEDRLQSGLMTLNEGRRAVLLSDADPLSLRAPIVGVWVSGGITSGAEAHAVQPSPFQHPYTYPACLRFCQLHTTRGARQGRRDTVGGADFNASAAARDAAAPASPAGFLVLHLPGGVSGSTPIFFEASATESDGNSGRAATFSAGFEQLDFSADVDVVVKEKVPGGGASRGAESRGRGGKEEGYGVKSRGSGGRTVVIGRLRRVSNPTFAQPFRSAQESAFRRLGMAQAIRRSPPPTSPQTSQSATTTALTSNNVGVSNSARWHVRHHATSTNSAESKSNPGKVDEQHAATAASASLDGPRQAPAPMAAPVKPALKNSPTFPSAPRPNHERVLGSSAPSAAYQRRHQPPQTTVDATAALGDASSTLPRAPTMADQSPTQTAGVVNVVAVEGRQTPSRDQTAPMGVSSSPTNCARRSSARPENVDLGSLGPAARALLLSQQQQLSDLEAQLRFLRAEISREAPPTPHSGVAGGRAPAFDDHHHHRTPSQNVPGSTAGVQRALVRGSSSQVMRPAVATGTVEEWREKERGQVESEGEVEASLSVAARVMVEASTNTSFAWGTPPADRTEASSRRISYTASTSHAAGDAVAGPVARSSATPAPCGDENSRSSTEVLSRAQTKRSAGDVPKHSHVHARNVLKKQGRAPTPPLPPSSGGRTQSRTRPSFDSNLNQTSVAESVCPNPEGEEACSDVAPATGAAISGSKGTASGGWTPQIGSAIVAQAFRRSGSFRRRDAGGTLDGRPGSHNNHGGNGDGGVLGGGDVSSSEDGSFASPSVALLRFPSAGLGGRRSQPKDRGMVGVGSEVKGVENTRAGERQLSTGMHRLSCAPGDAAASSGDGVDDHRTVSSARTRGAENEEEHGPVEDATAAAAAAAAAAVVITPPSSGQRSTGMHRLSCAPGDAAASSGDGVDDHRTISSARTRGKIEEEHEPVKDATAAAAAAAATAGMVTPPSSVDPHKEKFVNVDDFSKLKTQERKKIGDHGDGRESSLPRVGGSFDGLLPGGMGTGLSAGGIWRRSTTILPVSIVDLVVVPRIEFGELTDDELGSDFDEGETIGRIESKYLQGAAGKRAKV